MPVISKLVLKSILDLLLDAVCVQVNRPVDIRLAADKPAEMHDTLEDLDIGLGGPQGRITGYRGFDRGRDHGVIDVLAGTRILRVACAAYGHKECRDEQPGVGKFQIFYDLRVSSVACTRRSGLILR